MTRGEWIILIVLLAPWLALGGLYFVACCFRNLCDRNPRRRP